MASFRFPGPDVSFSELRGKVVLHLGPTGTVFDYAAACWTFPQSSPFFLSFSSSPPEQAKQSNPAHLADGEIQAENSSVMCPDMAVPVSQSLGKETVCLCQGNAVLCLVKAPRK